MKNQKLNLSELFDTIKRGAVDIFSEEGLYNRLSSGKSLKIKLGADPSRPDLHLGHSVPLRMLRKLQDAGHEIIFVIGDFTGMIGDPSGQNKTRAPLTLEETRQNGKSYFEQVTNDIRQAHILYACEIVRLYHGEKAIEQAKQRYHSIASGKAPDEMIVLEINGSEITIIDLLKATGFAESKSDAKRLITGGGIKIDGEKISDFNLLIKSSIVLNRGKSKFVQVRFRK